MDQDRPPILPVRSGRTPIAGLLAGLALLLAPPSGLLAETLIPDSVREAAQARIDAGHYQSLLIGVSDGGPTEWLSLGQLSQGGPAPDPHTLYEIGSLTKPFTAALLALAADHDTLSLDATVGEMLGNDTPLDHRLKEAVTLRQLATHQSGLPDTPDDLAPSDPNRLFEDYDRNRLLAFLSRHPLAAHPGQHFSYSNLGYALLGHLLEQHYSQAFDDALMARITTPLGLDSTALKPDPELLDREAPGYDYDLHRAPPWSWRAFQAAGSLRSTGHDLMQWMQAQQSPPDTPLGQALWRLHQPQFRLGGNGRAMGLGWQLLGSDEQRVAWHGGRTAGHAVFAAFQPEGKRRVVIMANTGNGVDHLGLALMNPAHTVPPLQESRPLDPKLGALYAGRYRLSPGFVVTVRQTEQGLYLRAPGRPSLRLYPLDDERFMTRGVESELRFVDNEAGGIAHLEIRAPHGGVQIATRMQSTDNPAPRTVKRLAPEELARFAGRFRINGTTEFHLEPDADRLLLSSGKGPSRPLYPAPGNRFFHRNQPLELEFAGQASGEPGTRLILYRNGQRHEAHRVGDDQ